MNKKKSVAPPEKGATKREIIKMVSATFGQIAIRLKVSVEKVRNIARQSLFRLRKSECNRRAWMICHLRRCGCSNKDIADRLGLAVSTINVEISHLIGQGRMKPLSRGRFLSPKDQLERENRIVKLRQAGYSGKEIAEKLKLSVPTISIVVHKLIGEGRIEPKRHEAFWRNLRDKRVRTIIKMVKTRATLQEVGTALGCTREWVRQVIAWMRAEHKDSIFKSEATTFWTPQEAAKELDVSINVITGLCRNKAIPTKRRGVKRNGAFLIDEKGMLRLRAHPLVKREKICVICRQRFNCGKFQNRQMTCSAECAAKYDRQRREAYAEKMPNFDSLRGWLKDLRQILNNHRLPKNEDWLTISQAARRTSLSKMQLHWLRYRHIVTIRPDPRKKWRGRPMATYAASELEIIRKVFEARKSRSGKEVH